MQWQFICQFSQQNAKKIVLACPLAKDSTESLRNSTDRRVCVVCAFFQLCWWPISAISSNFRHFLLQLQRVSSYENTLRPKVVLSLGYCHCYHRHCHQYHSSQIFIFSLFWRSGFSETLWGMECASKFYDIWAEKEICTEVWNWDVRVEKAKSQKSQEVSQKQIYWVLFWGLGW